MNHNILVLFFVELKCAYLGCIKNLSFKNEQEKH